MNHSTPVFRSLALLGAALLLLAPLAAFADGSIAGTLKHATQGTPLHGAAVRLMPGDREVATDREGAFFLTNVPAGSYTLEASYLGLEPKTVPVRVTDGQIVRADALLAEPGVVMLAAVNVESVREGQSRAINQQRTSARISNIISADAIGNLPDRTVGEALARLPGVNVVDDQFANIRGASAEHNAVTLDGDRLTASGGSIEETSVQYDTRAVDLSLIPAEMVGGIEVIKTLTPDMDLDAFGGTINLVTRSAFDLKERTINGKVEYISNRFRRQPGRAGSITYMDVLDKNRTLGLAATLTYRNEHRNLNDYEFSYYDPTQIPVGNSGSGALGAIPAVGDQAMEAYDTRLKFQHIKKLGATVNLDWKLSDTTELHFRTFYGDTDTQGGRYRLRVRATSRWSAASTAQLQTGNQVRLQHYLEDGDREIESLRLGFEGKTRLLSGGTLTYGVRTSNADETATRQRYIFDFPTTTERRLYSWTFDRRNALLPAVTVTQIATGQNGLLAGLADRKLNSVRFIDGNDNERDLTANLDYAFAQPIAGQAVQWKAGAKFRGKDRESRPHIEDYSPPAANVPTMAAFPLAAEQRNLLSGTQPTMGAFASLADVIGYFRNNRAAFAALPGSEIRTTDARIYDVNEDVLSAYAMGTTKIERLEIIAGVRWERTGTGYNWLSDPLGASKGKQHYDDYYPSLLLNYRFHPNAVARFAVTNTLSRPSYGDLIPYRAVDDTQSESSTGGATVADYPEVTKVFLGNAKLKAQQSRNFDFSLEYYLPQSGVVSAAIFRKNLRDIIYRSQFKIAGQPNTLYFQERNGSSGKADGLELSWQQALSFLPKPLDGFGVNLNATFVKGSSTLEELTPGTSATFRPVRLGFLPEQPKKVYNAQLWWEKYGVTARVAVNFIDEFVRTAGGLTANSINDRATRWDASVSYRLNKRFTVYLEGRNLTSEVTSWHASTSGRPEDYTYTGAIYTGGVKFRF